MKLRNVQTNKKQNVYLRGHKTLRNTKEINLKCAFLKKIKGLIWKKIEKKLNEREKQIKYAKQNAYMKI